MHRFNQFGACPNVPVSPSSPRNRILCVAQAKAAPKGLLVRFGIDLFGSRAHIEFSVEVYQVLVSVGVESLNSGLRWFLDSNAIPEQINHHQSLQMAKG